MKYLLIAVILTCYSNDLYCQVNEVFPNQIIINRDCNEKVIEGTIELWGSRVEPIKVFDLRSDLCEMEFFIDGRKLGNMDTLFANTEEELIIQFSFKNYTSEEKIVKFSTPYKSENTVQINLGSYFISHKEVKSGETTRINVKNNCSDSIKVYFPVGGTITSVTVHVDEHNLDSRKSTSFGMSRGVNYIRFARSEIGKYYIRYAACHWGENFWLELIE